MSINLIYARDINSGIGINNSLPWHIKEDLKHFKNLTLGNVLLMGRNTFVSLPASLPDREMVVISKTLKEGKWCNVTVFSDPVEALKNYSDGKKEVYIIGGAQIYQQLEKYADYVFETVIEKEYECDSFYCLEKRNFNIIDSQKLVTEDGIKLTFKKYKNLKKITL